MLTSAVTVTVQTALFMEPLTKGRGKGIITCLHANL